MFPRNLTASNIKLKNIFRNIKIQKKKGEEKKKKEKEENQLTRPNSQ